jgi:hypothetical protein
MSTHILVSWCLFSFWALGRPTQPPQRQETSKTAEQAAQVNLLVLRAIVKGGLSTKEYFLLPSRVPLSRDRASSALTAMRKPIECTATSQGLVLAVACHPLNEADAADWRNGARHAISVFEEAAREDQCPEPIRDARLLLHRRGDSLQVPLEVLAVWFRDYKASYALGVEDGTAPPRGVCMVIGVDPSPEIRIRQERTPFRSRT